MSRRIERIPSLVLFSARQVQSLQQKDRFHQFSLQCPLEVVAQATAAVQYHCEQGTAEQSLRIEAFSLLTPGCI